MNEQPEQFIPESLQAARRPAPRETRDNWTAILIFLILGVFLVSYIIREVNRPIHMEERAIKAWNDALKPSPAHFPTTPPL